MRKGVGLEGKAGAWARGPRAGPEAEIHGSGSEAGEALKDPDRPVDSKPGKEEQGSVGPRPSPFPRVQETRPRRESQAGELRAQTSGCKMLGIQIFTFSRKAGTLSSSVTKGWRITYLGDFAGWGGACTPGSWGEREAESRSLRFICVPRVESGMPVFYKQDLDSCISLEWKKPNSRKQSS